MLFISVWWAVLGPSDPLLNKEWGITGKKGTKLVFSPVPRGPAIHAVPSPPRPLPVKPGTDRSGEQWSRRWEGL